jgi:hypothetical protein
MKKKMAKLLAQKNQKRKGAGAAAAARPWLLPAGGGAVAALALDARASWWSARPFDFHGVRVEPKWNEALVSECRAVVEESAQSVQSAQSAELESSVQAHAYAGTPSASSSSSFSFSSSSSSSSSSSRRGLSSKAAAERGAVLVAMPAAAVLTRGDIFPSAAWTPRLIKGRVGKGFPKLTKVSALHQLALGVLGCWINQVQGGKVALAKAYYAAHFGHYPRGAYPFWDKHHRIFFNSMPAYGKRNAPGEEGLESWRVFSKIYTRAADKFAKVSEDTARKTYAMVHSQVDESKLVPLIDFANHHPTAPNAERACDAAGCRLVALRDIAEGEEITVSYGAHSNFDLLARFGFEAGAKDNLRAHALSWAGCSVHFESLDKYPETAGIAPDAWTCLTETNTQDVSAVFTWAQQQRAMLRKSLVSAKLSALLGHDDWLSRTLLRVHREQMGIFKADERLGPSYWAKKIDDAAEEEFAKRQVVEWNKKAVDAFEAGLKAAAAREAKEAAEWKKKAKKAFGATRL